MQSLRTWHCPWPRGYFKTHCSVLHIGLGLEFVTFLRLICVFGLEDCNTDEVYFHCMHHMNSVYCIKSSISWHYWQAEIDVALAWHNDLDFIWAVLELFTNWQLRYRPRPTRSVRSEKCLRFYDLLKYLTFIIIIVINIVVYSRPIDTPYCITCARSIALSAAPGLNRKQKNL